MARRSGGWTSKTLQDAIQTDAAVNPGGAGQQRRSGRGITMANASVNG
jgi:S1-C subfamily serine protease